MTVEPVTPELALVDPDLRRRLLAGAPIDVPQRLRRAGGSIVRVLPMEVPSTPEPIGSRGQYTTRLTSPLVVAACSSLVTVALIGAVVKLHDDGAAPATPAARAQQPVHSRAHATAHPVATPPRPQARPAAAPATKTKTTTTTASAPQSPPAATTKTTPPARQSPVSAPAAKTPRVLRFSWPAAAGAVSYDVRFYTRGSGSRLVLQLRTHGASAAVRVARRRGALAPGAYRWYVWPVLSTGRAAVATVQSTLTVS